MDLQGNRNSKNYLCFPKKSQTLIPGIPFSVVLDSASVCHLSDFGFHGLTRAKNRQESTERQQKGPR